MEIRSRYQKKNYEEVEYTLEEITCPSCDKPFMADYDGFPLVSVPDQARQFYQITCPYCRFRFYQCT